MRRGFQRILAFLVAERRTIGNGFVALLLATVGSLAAGVVLGLITGTLERLPGLMILVPAAVATRGNIFGALGSRLGTSIHAGLFETGRGRGGVVYQNVFAATVLTVAVSLAAALLARAFAEAFGIATISVVDFVVISLVGGILASLFVGGFALALAVRAYRRGWDLDTVAAPLITAAGDMFTIPALYLASFLVGIRWVSTGIAVAMAVLALVLLVVGLTTRLQTARRILRESIPVLVVAAAVDILAGLVVQARLGEFVLFPALLMLIPPILGNAGGLGGLLSSRLTSKLHLGVLTPRGRPESVALLDAAVVLLIALAIFPVLGAAAEALALLLGLPSPGLVRMIGVSLIAGVTATLLALLVAYYSAVASYRLGLDPDNHGIPMITSSMDFAGVLSLVVALAVVGVA
ncbi:MAG TPA: magnesium transporter [Actinomycetota bacterium]|nr:magnesium transporter [Actinomycetota bacterium]